MGSQMNRGLQLTAEDAMMIPVSELSTPRDRTWVPIAGFCFMTLVLLAVPGVLRLAYPLLAFALGLYFYFRAPSKYLSFTLWLYFLSPFVRRLADYRIGEFIDGNTILLAPALVTLIALLSLRHLPARITDGWLTLILLLGTVSFGGAVGFLFLSDRQAVVKSLIGWICPLAFAAHIYLNWRDYPEVRRTLERTAVGGLLVVGIYGVIQFCFAPPWDVLWMNAMEYDAASGPGVYGEPLPFAIRTFSTMNSHQPMAIVLIILGVFALTKRKRLYSVAVGIGMLPVLFSLARTAWLQAFVSFIMLVVLTRETKYLKVFGVGLLALLVLGIGLSFTPFGDTLQARISSFSDKSDDISVGARQAGYSKGIRLAEEHPFGMGAGGMEVAYTPVIYEDFGPNDSALVELLVQFGVAGAAAMFLAIFIGLRMMYVEFRKTKDVILAAVMAIWAGLLIQSPLNSCFDGAHGVFVWTAFGLGIASVNYSRSKRECEASPVSLPA